MKIPIKLSKEIEAIIRDKLIVIIVGDMGCGKTSTSSCVATLFKKDVYVVIPNYHEEDEEIFDNLGFNKIIVDTTATNTQKLKSALKDIKDCVVIFDDYHSSSIRQREVIKQISVDLRKRRMKLILVYHSPEGIPKRLLKDNNSILLLKRNNGMNYYKLSQYLTTKGITKSASEYVKTIKDFDTTYLLKSGKYIHRYSNNLITRGIIKPDEKATIKGKVDTKKVLDDVIKGEKSKIELANKYGISQSTLYKIVKDEKETNPRWEKMYSFSKKKNNLSKIFPKPKGEWEKKGIQLTIIDEIFSPYNLSKQQQSCSFDDLKDIGDLATQVIGESIYTELKKLTETNKLDFAEIYIIKGRGGCDVKIEIPDKIIDIEIKNWDKPSKQPNMGKLTIKHKVLPRFKDSIADKKYLFCLGRGCNRQAKYLLKQNNIEYWRLTNTQLKQGDKDKIYGIKQRMKKFVTEIVS